MEVVMVVDLLVKEQVMLVEWAEVGMGKQLVVKDIDYMIEDMANMADDIVDMAVNMVDMVEDMTNIVGSIVETVSIVVVGNFGAAMAWVYSTNSEHTSNHVQEIVNSGLGTYLEVEVLATMVSLRPENTHLPYPC